ncbi:MAG: cytochrome C biosynthesis protein, partial [Thermoplasmatota archaeon]
MFTFFSPCGFPMLPAYVAYLLTGGDAGERASFARALAAGLAASLGFFLVFIALGAVAVAIGGRLEPIVPAGELVAGVLLVALGILFLAGRAPGFTVAARGPTAGAPGATFRFGVLYAVVCLA